MIKHVFVFEPSVNPIEADRYYFRFHGPEVVRFVGPWLRRYETYRAYDAPREAERFGVLRGRLTELWYASVDEWREANPYRRAYTAPSGGWEAFFGRDGAAVTMVPAMPTDDFLGKEPAPEERPILRWYQVIRYPDGVAREAGDKWYAEVHANELARVPGLLKFTSHAALSPLPFPTPWVRVSELWFEDFAAWRKAVVESGARYTPPPWGGEFPFVPMASTFVGCKPDVDFLRDRPLIP
jgi:hypothetical protein